MSQAFQARSGVKAFLFNQLLYTIQRQMTRKSVL